MLPVPVDEFERLLAMLSEEAPHVAQADVCEELIRGARDLDGQILPEALAEMLYVLVRYRLSQWPAHDRTRLYRAAS